MPHRCCVPKCRGNYDASGPKVAVFGFPQDPDLRKQWLQLIKREQFIPTKASKVCELHFQPNFIEKKTTFRNETTGEVLEAPLKIPRLVKGCLAFGNVKINVPIAVVRGKNAELECSYDFGGEKLYSVKWYRDSQEIFSYTPTQKEPIKLFLKKGIDVRLNESTATKIVLEKVSREISGKFSCEVTAEVPNLFTDMQTAELQVVDIPKNNPYITGVKKRYSMEDEVFQANCTSADSYPAANITWYINGFPKKGPQIKKNTISTIGPYGQLQTVISTIRQRLEKRLFIKHRMNLRCEASIFDVYHHSTEVTLELIKNHKHHRHESPLTTKTPLVVEEQDYDKYEHNGLAETPPETTLSFWSPSKAATGLMSSITHILSTLLVILVAVTMIR